jgi:PhoH-like ATPase
MKKNFVFDTNVLLADPYAIMKFEDNNVVIPITVIEELDKFKRDLNAVGRSAREATRLLDKYREAGDLSKGVRLENGGMLRVVTDLGKEPPMPFPTLGKTADSLIIAAALLLKKRENLPVIFVTRDINLRIRADVVGLKAVTYEEEDSITIEEMYLGRVDIKVPGGLVDALLKEGVKGDGYKLLPNQCVALIDEKDPNHVALGRYHRSEGKILPILENVDMWGITARNPEQRFAVDLLLDDSVQLVTLVGKAGTGKTLLAIAAGLKKVMDDNAFSKLAVARPIVPFGKDIGFLPGEMGEKLRPWMQPVFDNLEFIMDSRSGVSEGDVKSSRGFKRGGKEKRPLSEGIRQLMDMGVIEVEALTYIRGRSMPRQFIIIDEAQNLTSREVKTIITRAGEGTKVIFTGDPYQIDNPFLDFSSSGLTVLAEKFKGEDITGHILLTKGERSPLAELASNKL